LQRRIEGQAKVDQEEPRWRPAYRDYLFRTCESLMERRPPYEERIKRAWEREQHTVRATVVLRAELDALVMVNTCMVGD